MENNHVEIHDPFSNRMTLEHTSNSDPKRASDTNGTEDSVEFRLLMAYARRRRPNNDPEDGVKLAGQMGDLSSNGTPLAQTPAQTEKEEEKKKRKKKKKGGKGLLKFFSCIKPLIKDEENLTPAVTEPDVEDRCGYFKHDEVKELDKVEEAASMLTGIADEIPFTPPEIEADSDGDEVEKVIGLLLRETGDKLNEEINIKGELGELFSNYGFFERVINTLLTRMGLISPQPDALGPQSSPKTQIAVTCEATSRLSAINTLPMSRMLNYGAEYLQRHYSSWVQRHGGYEEAFYSEDEDDNQ